MERQVFISYAANDTDWTAERVAAFAERLDALEVRVHLDVWYRRKMNRDLADAEWRKWMDESMALATHVVCLCSRRYFDAWTRDESVSAGCGVAFESTRIEAYLYRAKQNNKGRVLTLVNEQGGRDVIPSALKDACPPYTFGKPDDDQFLWSHLSVGVLPIEPDYLGNEINEGDADIRVLRGNASSEAESMLRFQADHASDLLEKCPDLWRKLRDSNDLKECLGGVSCDTPIRLVSAFTVLDAEMLQDAMVEIREVFSDVRSAQSESKKRLQIAEATVALYLLCVCLLIRVQSPSLVSGLPRLKSENAANLFAALIAALVAGGRVSLEPGRDPDDPVMPKGKDMIEIQVEFPPKIDPGIVVERALHSLLIKGLKKHMWTV